MDLIGQIFKQRRPRLTAPCDVKMILKVNWVVRFIYVSESHHAVYIKMVDAAT